MSETMDKDMENPAVVAQRLWPWLLGLTLPLYILDQITKFWVVGRFSDPPEGANFSYDPPIVVIEGYFNLVRVHNNGVAFGMGSGTAWAPIVFMIIPLIALALITIGLRRNFFVGKTGMVAVALLVCGILGNLTDRLVQGSLLEVKQGAPLWERIQAGYVVDFLDFTIPLINYRWPSFNVADACICVAAFLLVISGWRAETPEPATKEV